MSSLLRRFGIVAAIALVAVYAAVVLRGPQGLPALAEKRRVIRELQEQNATLTREIQQKRARIHNLREDPRDQELEVRKEMKLQRPGETTFILPESDAKPAPPAPRGEGEQAPESTPAQ